MPSWLEDLPEDERDAAKARFLVRLCALYDNPASSIGNLSEALGYQRNSLITITKGGISPNVALALERRLGREIAPREVLNPAYFAIPA
jgi:hypothetical protein